MQRRKVKVLIKIVMKLYILERHMNKLIIGIILITVGFFIAISPFIIVEFITYFGHNYYFFLVGGFILAVGILILIGDKIKRKV